LIAGHKICREIKGEKAIYPEPSWQNETLHTVQYKAKLCYINRVVPQKKERVVKTIKCQAKIVQPVLEIE
jgi:hypothetical protein